MTIPAHAFHYRLENHLMQKLGEDPELFRARVAAAREGGNHVLGVSARHPAVRNLLTWRGVSSLFIQGPVGVGKTSLLAALYYRAKELASDKGSGWERVYFEDPRDDQVLAGRHYALRRFKGAVDAPVFLTEHELHDLFSEKERGDRGPLEYAFNCGVLMLDDLGVSQRKNSTPRAREFIAQRVEELVGYRYAKGIPIVITSNHSLKDLATLYSERLASRLGEHCAVHEMGGVNWREG